MSIDGFSPFYDDINCIYFDFEALEQKKKNPMR